MLQQTQVVTVIGYFDRFVARFPDLSALARADLDEVLALWSGLGYYSRARNLHACARAVISRFGGRFPRSAAELAQLPGIGRSTAAAISAFCFGERAAILDGNVRRLLARHGGFAGDLAESREMNRLWGIAESLLPESGIGVYTQGLMDLGASVCLPRSPRCAACPVAADCAALAVGDPGRFPVRSRRLVRGERRSRLLWITRGESVWLCRRERHGVWAGLWCLPEFPGDSGSEFERKLAEFAPPRKVPPIHHALTHFDWTLEPIRFEIPSATGPVIAAAIESGSPDGRWYERDQALALGLPAPVRRLLIEWKPQSSGDAGHEGVDASEQAAPAACGPVSAATSRSRLSRSTPLIGLLAAEPDPSTGVA